MKKNILIGLFCSLTFLLNMVSAQQTITKNMEVNGIKRSYILYIPSSYNTNVKVPLLFCFHGYNMDAVDQMDYGDFRKIADTAHFILVYPQGSLMNNVTHWNVGGWTIGSTANDIGFTRAMIDTLSASYQIDTTRIYSTGYSNGGFFSFELACQMGEKIAAIGSVCGSMTPETFNHCDPNHPMPILQIHGTNDPIIRYTGETYSLPIDSTLAYWKRFNQTDSNASINLLPNINTTDGCTVETQLYDHGLFCNAVMHYKIVNGKHTWPGANDGSGIGTNRDINASEVIWNFVSQYSIHGKIGCATLSTSTIYNSSKLYRASPNPTNDIISINLNPNEICKFVILSPLGQIMTSGQISAVSPTIDLSSLGTGLYFLRLGNQTIKIIKSN